MLKSMTGYGAGRASGDGYSFTVEIKSVNHKLLDLVIRAPRDLMALEENTRRKFQEQLTRGRVEVFISMENISAESKTVEIDLNLAGSYYQALQNLKTSLSLTGSDITAGELAAFPDILKVTKTTTDLEQAAPVFNQALDQAVAQLVQQRAEEGARLEKDIAKHLHTIRELVLRLRDKGPVLLEEYRNKLEARLEEILGGKALDRQRFMMEVAFFAERCNIDEELTRLESHIESFFTDLASEEAVGRKLNFLLQEMNREVNTVASKSSDLEVSRLALEGKSEIEKIREQVQNIE